MKLSTTSGAAAPTLTAILLAALLGPNLCGCSNTPPSVDGDTGVTFDTLADFKPPADAVGPNDAGGSSAWIGPKGGTVDLLRFAVFGDVRPHNMDQDADYPAKVVQQIFTRVAARKPQFVLGVGDWMFASNYTHAKAQLTALLAAEKPYAHQVFHAMGNHECNGWTSSNCPRGDETGQVRAYFEELLPYTKKAYFSFTIKTRLGDTKVVVTAPNAWDPAQQSWLQQVMQQKTRYTIVVRHEPSSDTRAPGVKPSDAIFKSYPVTLYLFGHYHEYRHLSANQVISGNGGAPLASGSHFGYLWVEQLRTAT